MFKPIALAAAVVVSLSGYAAHSWVSDNTMQCSMHADRATDSEAKKFSKRLIAFRPKPSDRVINIGQMEKALVHSSPSSASILLPAASTSTDRKRCSRSRGKGFVHQDLPVAKRLFAADLYVNPWYL
jgi:hypothetical protein